MRFGFGFLLTAMLSVGALAQSAPGPTFEVVSVKPCDPRKAASGEEFLRMLSVAPVVGGRFYQPCATIVQLAMFAYDLHQGELRDDAGTPLQFFEIDARAGAQVPIDEMRLMVRQLLMDRFALRSHTEVVTRDVYTLVLARPDGSLGPNAKRAQTDCGPTVLDTPDEARRVHCTNYRGGSVTGEGVVTTETYNGITMARLARWLSSGARLVVDGTALAGVFDVTYSYQSAPQVSDAPLIGRSDAAARDRALEQQLGLKLVRSPAGQVEVRVIASVTPPTPN